MDVVEKVVFRSGWVESGVMGYQEQHKHWAVKTALG